MEGEDANEREQGEEPRGSDPFEINISNGAFEFNGYPNAAKIVHVDTAISRRISTLRQHQHRLMSCDAAIKASSKVSLDPDIAEMVVSGIAVTFFSCFKGINSTTPLDAKEILRGYPELIDLFSRWEAIRNTRIAHNTDAISRTHTGYILNSSDEVLDVATFQIEAHPILDPGYTRALKRLIDAAMQYISVEIRKAAERLRKDGIEMSPQDRASLPVMSVTAPGGSDVHRRSRRSQSPSLPDLEETSGAVAVWTCFWP